jgi:hypothetical protein
MKYKVLNPYFDFYVYYDETTKTFTHTAKSYFVMHTTWQNGYRSISNFYTCSSFGKKKYLECSCDSYHVDHAKNLKFCQYEQLYCYECNQNQPCNCTEPDDDNFDDTKVDEIDEKLNQRLLENFIKITKCDCCVIKEIKGSLWLIKNNTMLNPSDFGIPLQLKKVE